MVFFVDIEGFFFKMRFFMRFLRYFIKGDWRIVYIRIYVNIRVCLYIYVYVFFGFLGGVC